MVDYSDYAGKTPISYGSQNDFIWSGKHENQLLLVSGRIKCHQRVIPMESGENHKTVCNQ